MLTNDYTQIKSLPSVVADWDVHTHLLIVPIDKGLNRTRVPTELTGLMLTCLPFGVTGHVKVRFPNQL